ncbi:ATP-dependent nuclease [Pseudomonas sp. NPDC088444]|uniref:ATP-dependent nuclease n=1 Tax=Pseudomonas sp. NPDC088444 TaxID=3364456 RepID=UPI0038515CAD
MQTLTTNTLEKQFQFSNSDFEPFIRHMRFPKYKNLEAGLRIEFSHPITALVGENGTNKSSILRALYGAPSDNSPGSFWFSTSLDPIEEDGGAPNCFIYGYFNSSADEIVEVLKTRSKYDKTEAGQNPDYWEPSRPIIKYGMSRMPKIAPGDPLPEGRSKTRWNVISKNVKLLDFRTELSAYDKFFYHGDFFKTDTLKTKQDFIRHKSSHLFQAIESKSPTYIYYGREKIEDKLNRNLTKEEIEGVSYVLGRTYLKVELIGHNFFKNAGKTVRLTHSDIRYSEAFAGSGEFAAVMLVVGILEAQPNSLILLDEPEVSLHPGAQERLMKFLESQVSQKKHQVILSTHSPAIIRNLPSHAIKTLTLDSASNKVVLVAQSLSPDDAFFYIGEPSTNIITIVVEDRLAKAIVERALKSDGVNLGRYDIKYIPGGADTLWTTYIPIFAAAGRNDILFLLDGDKFKPAIRRSIDIPESENTKLGDEIKKLTGCTISFKIDGNVKTGGNKNQLYSMQRNFIDWASEYVDFLPMKTAEDFIIQNSKELAANSKTQDSKEIFRDFARQKLDRKPSEIIKSDEIFTIQCIELATVPKVNQDFKTIRSRIKRMNGPSKT